MFSLESESNLNQPKTVGLEAKLEFVLDFVHKITLSQSLLDIVLLTDRCDDLT